MAVESVSSDPLRMWKLRSFVHGRILGLRGLPSPNRNQRQISPVPAQNHNLIHNNLQFLLWGPIWDPRLSMELIPTFALGQMLVYITHEFSWNLPDLRAVWTICLLKDPGPERRTVPCWKQGSPCQEWESGSAFPG